MSKPTEYILKKNPKVNYGLRVIMIYQCRLNYTNVPFWVGDVDRGESYECGGAGTHGKSLEFPLSFVVNQKLLYAILILLPCPAIPPSKRI